MYTIIRVAGRQYRAEVGKTLDVDKLPYDVDHKLVIEDVLLVGDGDNTVLGQPLVEGAKTMGGGSETIAEAVAEQMGQRCAPAGDCARSVQKCNCAPTNNVASKTTQKTRAPRLAAM